MLILLVIIALFIGLVILYLQLPQFGKAPSGDNLERWGYSPDRIIEKDWYESLSLEKGMTLHTLPTRHFSGRTFRRNKNV